MQQSAPVPALPTLYFLLEKHRLIEHLMCSPRQGQIHLTHSGSTEQDSHRPVLLHVYFGGYIAFPITSPMVSAASRIISGVAWVYVLRVKPAL